MIALALLGFVAGLLGLLVMRLVRGGSEVANADRHEQETAQRVAGKAAAIRVLEQLDVSGSQGGAPPSSS